MEKSYNVGAFLAMSEEMQRVLRFSDTIYTHSECEDGAGFVCEMLVYYTDRQEQLTAELAKTRKNTKKTKEIQKELYIIRDCVFTLFLVKNKAIDIFDKTACLYDAGLGILKMQDRKNREKRRFSI